MADLTHWLYSRGRVSRILDRANALALRSRRLVTSALHGQFELWHHPYESTTSDRSMISQTEFNKLIDELEAQTERCKQAGCKEDCEHVVPLRDHLLDEIEALLELEAKYRKRWDFLREELIRTAKQLPNGNYLVKLDWDLPENCSLEDLEAIIDVRLALAGDAS